ncbi:hypothetical protein ACWDG1_49050 [Streptomyces sp. NPDC001177]
MTLPTGWSEREPTGLEIAMQWAELPAEHLQAALKALEPQLRREHEIRMTRMHLDAEEASALRTHRLYLFGLVAGFIVTLGMLTGAVIVGNHGQDWLAAMLSGPSVLALATVFVLRRSDAAQARAVTQAQRQALNALAQATAPPAGSGTSGPA